MFGTRKDGGVSTDRLRAYNEERRTIIREWIYLILVDFLVETSYKLKSPKYSLSPECHGVAYSGKVYAMKVMKNQSALTAK